MTTHNKSDVVYGKGYSRDKEECAVCYATHRVKDGLCPRCRTTEPEVRIVTVKRTVEVAA